jgi:hypothetical protein
VEEPSGREAGMGGGERRSRQAVCEPYPSSFEARSVYTDKDRTVVVTGRCRCSRHGATVFLDPEGPMGLEPGGTLRLRWTISGQPEGTGGGPDTATVHEIFDVPQSVTAVSIEGVGLVPIEEPAD